MDPEVEALYGLPLDEFIKARDALAKARSKTGDEEGAAVVKALRKPPVAAWALNQLARQHPADVGALLEAGARVRRAQTAALEGGDPAELREATRAENHELQALAGLAASILKAAGRGGSQEERLAATLRAAAVDPEAGDRLRRGVLTEELSPAGFGFGFGVGDEAVPSLSLTSPRPAGRGEQKQQRDEEKRAEREHRRGLEAELRAAQETASRLDREADRAEEHAREARKAAAEAGARAEKLARQVSQAPE